MSGAFGGYFNGTVGGVPGDCPVAVYRFDAHLGRQTAAIGHEIGFAVCRAI